jgi:hypothetical protein
VIRAVPDREDRIRSQEQNAKLHAMCRDIAKQLTWAGRQWSEEDWKRILLGGKFGQRFVPSPFGHSVVMVNNKRSSHLDAEKFSDFLMEIQAFGDEQGVVWSKDSLG